MRAGDFVGAKIYRKPTEDKRIKKDAWSALWSASLISRA